MNDDNVILNAYNDWFKMQSSLGLLNNTKILTLEGFKAGWKACWQNIILEMAKCNQCNHFAGMHQNWQESCWENDCECKWFQDKDASLYLV